MYAEYLQRIAISLAVSFYLAQKPSRDGRGRNNVLNASLDLQNHQKTFFNGFAGQEMHLGHYILLCPNTPTGLYAHTHAGTAYALNKVRQPAK